MQSLSSLRKDRSVRLRMEYFGGLAWRTHPRRIYRLDRPATAVLLLHDEPRPTGAPPQVAALGVSEPAWQQAVTELTAQGLLESVSASPIPITAANVAAADEALTAQTPQQPVLRPFWAHLQPFTRCNQHCIHCYCFGSSKADPFLLPIPAWKSIVDRLDAYGVLDVYLTGGENLLYNDFFALAEDILSRGLGFGLSTNATVLSEATLARLRELRIETVQVSLDGGERGHARVHTWSPRLVSSNTGRYRSDRRVRDGGHQHGGQPAESSGSGRHRETRSGPGLH